MEQDCNIVNMLQKRKRFFNEMAHKWDSGTEHDEGKINYILNSIPLIEGNKVLDIGTGTGVLIPFIMGKCNKDCKITAVDYSENMISVAKEKNPHENINFVVKDVYTLDEEYKDYDVCICYSVFPHFVNKLKAIRLLSKRVKKGGKFIIAHSQSRSRINDVHRKKSLAVKYDTLPVMNTLIDYFHKCNLKVIKTVDNSEMFLIVGERV